MKAFLVPALVIVSGLANATGLVDDSAFKSKGVSSTCETIILNAVEKRCNADSLRAEGKSRMNPCQDFEADISSSGKFQGELEAGGSAGDADTYWYAITVRDAASCKFSLTSEQ